MFIGRLLFILLLIAEFSYAQPVITNVTGSFTQGGTLTISGTGFGTKTPLPQVYDNFEDGLLANPTIGTWTNTNIFSMVSPFGRPNSTYAAFCNVTNSDGRCFFMGGERQETTYVSFRYYLSNWTWGTAINQFLGNVKIFRMFDASGQPNFVCSVGAWYSCGMICYTEFAGSTDWVGCPSEINKVSWAPSPSAYMTPGYWHSLEYEYRESTPGANDGIFRMWHDGAKVVDSDTDVVGATGILTRNEGNPLKYPFIIGFFNSAGSGSANFFMDDVYLDNTFARVMICGGSTWSSRGWCENQIATSWSDTQIQISSVYKGLLEDIAYVYVIDADGRRSNGFEAPQGQQQRRRRSFFMFRG